MSKDYPLNRQRFYPGEWVTIVGIDNGKPVEVVASVPREDMPDSIRVYMVTVVDRIGNTYQVDSELVEPCELTKSELAIYRRKREYATRRISTDC